MWTRAELKGNAINVLKRTYWLSFLVYLILVAIMSGIGGIVGAVGGIGMMGATVMGGAAMGSGASYAGSGELLNPASAVAVMAMLGMYAVIFALVWILEIFLGNSLAVGMCRYFMRAREGDGQIADLFWAFSGGRYWPVVKVMFIMSLKVLLWSLLFIIPGIIKGYQYYMIPYLLAENPNLPTERYFEITKNVMEGEKGATFVLQLSFLGWALLGSLLCGLGVFFLDPYIMATNAELCALLHAKAIATGAANEQELCGYRNVGMNM